MTEPDQLMTIGDFARETGLTAKALRLYDELELVSPAEVDQYSGYRRYDPSQLGRARLVAQLRLLGMPLARITRVLDLSPSAAAQDVEAYWTQVEADVETRRQLVTTLVDQLRSEAPPMTTTTTSLHAEYGTSHRRGRRDRQQDALLVTPRAGWPERSARSRHGSAQHSRPNRVRERRSLPSGSRVGPHGSPMSATRVSGWSATQSWSS